MPMYGRDIWVTKRAKEVLSLCFKIHTIIYFIKIFCEINFETNDSNNIVLFYCNDVSMLLAPFQVESRNYSFFILFLTVRVIACYFFRCKNHRTSM